MGRGVAGILALGLMGAAVWAGEPLRLDVTRDTWVSSYQQGRSDERDYNLGGRDRLKLKGIQEFILLDIDPASFRKLRGRVLVSAQLHLRSAASDVARRVTVGSLASAWVEGTSTGYRPQKGSACFRWARLDEQSWAYLGSDITAVMAGQGYTAWGFADASVPDAQGWQSVAVEPRVLAARVAGISQGFVVLDDVGSEYEHQGDKFTYHLFPNRYFYSREAGSANAPYFTVQLGAEDRQPPAPVEGIVVTTAHLPAGEALVSWPTPADIGPAGTLGFFVRWTEGESFVWDSAVVTPQYLVPLAEKPGARVTLHLRDWGLTGGETLMLGVRPVDAAGNVGAVTTVTFQLPQSPAPVVLDPSPVAPFTQAAALPTVGGVQVAVIDALDKMQPVTGAMIPAHDPAYLQANHLWSADRKLIRLHAARNEFVPFQIVLQGQTPAFSAALTFPAAGATAPIVELLRFRHALTERGPLPDPLVSMPGPLSIPATDETIPGQHYATLLADIYVPHEAAPGLHQGKLTLQCGGQTLTLDVEMHVWNFTLPDQLSFVPEMNCYGLPAAPLDLAYYRLAHAHRTSLNRLPYNWQGCPGDGLAPRLENGRLRWEEYDRRFGPLLDGSAFRDLPRRGVPVDTFYLPLNENWPVPIASGFTGGSGNSGNSGGSGGSGGYWADQALTPEYRAAFVAACGEFARHFAQRGWNRTRVEFFLNGKVSYNQDRWGRCSAPWLFDEPVNTQDFWALRWYGQAFHTGVASAFSTLPQRHPPIFPCFLFRCDLSRPQWQRDILDGVADIEAIGGDYSAYQRQIQDRQDRTGMTIFNYGDTNAITQSNVQPAAWCVAAWSRGAAGVIPWQTIGAAQAWHKADEQALFYPGDPLGRRNPAPSIRLKSYRAGQQLVEYLTLLETRTGQPRWRIVPLAAPGISPGATPHVLGKNPDQTDPADLWELRLRVGAMLARMH